MRKLLICLMLFCSFSIPSFAASWYWISQSSGINSWIDNAAVSKNQYGAEVWIKLVYPNKRTIINKYFIGRNSRNYFIEESVFYDSYGHYQGKRTYPQTWQEIIPGSNMDIVYNLIW